MAKQNGKAATAAKQETTQGDYTLDEALAASTREMSSAEALHGVAIERHAAIARQYKRSIRGFRDTLTEMVTLDADTATECCYSLPRGASRITGPSVRFAEAAAQAWGTLDGSTTIVRDDAAAAIVIGRCHDLETNYTAAMETRRPVHKKKFKPAPDEDDKQLAVAVATSLAYRNSVLRVIPKALWWPVYQAAIKASTGEGTMAEKRDRAIGAFRSLGATDVQVLAALGRKGVEDVTLDDLQHLRGMFAAIRDKKLTLEQALTPPEAEKPRGPASLGRSNLAAKIEAKEQQTAEPEPMPEHDPGTGETKPDPMDEYV
jgi:hypothetical protein